MSAVNSVYQKIHLIMKEISYLKEDGEIKFKDGGKGFAIISEEKVFRVLRLKMVEHKLVLLPIKMQQVTNPIGIVQSDKGTMLSGKSNLSEVDAQFNLVDVETGDSTVLACSGAGEDQGDKGIAKAITRLYKSLLLKLFIIPTGKDPDLFENNPEFDSEPMKEDQTELPKSLQNIKEGIAEEQKKEIKVEKTKLTQKLVGEVLTEFMTVMGQDDMTFVKKEILTPCGSSKLSEIKPERYPEIIDKIDNEYIKTGIEHKTPKLLIAKSAL